MPSKKAHKSGISAKGPTISELLAEEYPDAECALLFSNPLELLVATILSAQCTDVKVNQVTRSLFKKYRSAKDYASADPDEFQKEIHSTGFFRAKTKSIIASCLKIVEKHAGKVPKNVQDLTDLPGVGRKTANVVLGNAFGIPGIVVDTHVKRVAERLGLTKETDPDKIERDLCAVIPEDEWTIFSHRVTHHGRKVCGARKPKCTECILKNVCLFYEKNLDKEK